MAAPVFTDLDDTPSYTENSTSAVLDGNATISDADLGVSDPFTGATLTLVRQGGASPDDVFALREVPFGQPAPATFSDGQVLVTESDPDLGEVNVAIGSYINSGGTLTIVFNDQATAARINTVLQNLTYANASEAPPASVQIDYTFDNGEQATGSITVAITAANDVPIIDQLDGTALYAPGSSGVVLSSGIVISDVDSPTLSQATVTIAFGFDADDVLSADVGATGITASYVSNVLTLSGTATIEQYRQVLATVAYSSSNDNPGASGERSLEWQIFDADGAPSALQGSTIDFSAVIDLDQSAAGTGFATTFTENGSAVAVVDSDVVITSDDGTLSGATVTLTNAQAGDTLSAPGAPIPFTIDSSTPGQITLTFSGFFSTSQYETALEAVLFNSPGDAPVAGVRDIAISVLDSSGNASNVAHASVTVNGANDPGSASDDTAATNGNVVLHADAANGVLANDSDPDGLTVITGNVATSQGGTIQFAADGSYTYTPPADFAGTDTVGYTAQDPFNNQVSATLSITVGPQAGTPGNDSYNAAPGSSAIDGGYGTDQITFGFRLVDATVTYSGNTVVIDGPSSHTVLTGFETFVFTDGTVHNDDGNVLVDDLFYYSQNHDVWNAHVDAEAHYNSVGWHENRDPNAFFSTLIYLSANSDVQQAGINPLTHFDQTGWKQGRVPSLDFDPAQYLADNPDVAAAHIDPLVHFLSVGAGEGRLPPAPTALVTSSGFDYVYYLQNNPDVAAAHVDPFQHFQTVGWHEGRNPNAFFDVAGYLANYGDVAAANINPLDHYHASGWHEGRDPSLAFDTTAYLAANPDVAAANVDPLVHFLQTGQHEGRQAIADSTWGSGQFG
jgi:lipopolysaccharide export system protein LptA